MFVQRWGLKREVHRRIRGFRAFVLVGDVVVRGSRSLLMANLGPFGLSSGILWLSRGHVHLVDVHWSDITIGDRRDERPRIIDQQSIPEAWRFNATTFILHMLS